MLRASPEEIELGSDILAATIAEAAMIKCFEGFSDVKIKHAICAAIDAAEKTGLIHPEDFPTVRLLVYQKIDALMDDYQSRIHIPASPTIH